MKTSAAVGAVSRLEGLVGADAFTAETNKLDAYTIDGITPAAALHPGSPEEIVEVVKFAAAEGLTIVPCGARTKLGIGLPPSRYDIALDLTKLNRIAAYDPGDLTLSVEPGVLLSHLQRTLHEHGQFLPHGAPFMTRATIGGTVVSGVDGPLRQLYGTVRDFVLGMEFVTGDGVAGKSGGRVVKNVTGYDLHKLMIGSLGTLGILTKINFRTFPAPQLLRGFVAHFPTAQDCAACRDSLTASALRPMTLEILSPSAADLFVKAEMFQAEPLVLPEGLFSAREWTLAASFAGNEGVLDRCETDLRKLAESVGATHFARVNGTNGKPELVVLGAVFTRLREFAPIALAASTAATVMKLSVLPEHLEHALAASKHAAEDHSLRWASMARGAGLIYVALLPETKDEKSRRCVTYATIRIQDDCARLGGHSMIPWCPGDWKRSLRVWGPEREDFPLMRKVKAVFDPSGILAPGRFMGGI